jgi:hypothetical protein
MMDSNGKVEYVGLPDKMIESALYFFCNTRERAAGKEVE